MKHILDPEFKYAPSYATDIRETFARVAKEQQEKEVSEPEAEVRDVARTLS